MDLDVNLDLNASSTDIEMKVAPRRFHIDSTSSHASNTGIEFSPSNSSMSSSETKRLGGRRLSTTPGSSKQGEVINTPITKQDSEKKSSSQVPTRRRRSRVLLQETTEYEGSALFSKPSSSTRPRLSMARRYSPSPENRTKLKSIAALLQNKAKQLNKSEKNKMVFCLSQLPICCDATSGVLLEYSVDSDPSDFILYKETAAPLPEPDEDVQIFSPTQSASTSTTHVIPVKEEVKAADSSDEDEEDENNKVTYVRMADIGAAPFTAASPTPLTVSVAVKSRKRPRSLLPVIKLPRRRTLGGMSKLESADTATQPQISIKSPKIVEVSSKRKSESVVLDVKSPSHVEEVFLEVPLTKKPERLAAEVKSSSRTKKGLISEVRSRKKRRVSSEAASTSSIEKRPVSVENDQSPGITEEHKSPPVKRMRKSEPASAPDRPKRASAGKTLNFLAQFQVTKRKRSTPRASIETARDEESQSCSTPTAAADTSKRVSTDADNTSIIAHPLKTTTSGRRSSASASLKITPTNQEEVTKTREELPEAHSPGASSATHPSTRSASVASSDQTFVCDEEESNRELERPRSGGRGRGRRRSSLVKVRAARRSKISVVAERTSPAPTLKPSPALLNVRRSGRSHIVPSKIRDSEPAELQPESHDAWTPAKNVNPNSALGILRRVSRYSRPLRSPSPQPSAVLPKRDVKAAVSPVAPTTTPNVEVGLEEPSEGQSKEVPVPFKDDDKTVSDTSKKDGEEALEHSGEQINEPSKSHEEESEMRADVAESSSVPADNLVNVQTTESAKSSRLDDKNGEEKPLEEKKEPEKAKTQDVVGISPSAHATGRISSRAVRPSSRFLNADFISPLRRRRGGRQKISAQEVTTDKPSELVVADGGSAGENAEKSDALAERKVDSTPIQSGASSLPKTKPVVVGRSHVMKTRRVSDEQPRIKLKIKLGRTPWIKILGSTNDAKAEAPTPSEVRTSVPEKTPHVVPVKPKAPAKRYISPWSHYVPSVKPVLGNVYYSDGTVEKLGVSVNAVMDRLLAEVCQDGISRHSAIINKREKRKRNIEKARERVHRLKEERAARMALGYVPATSKTPSSEPIHQNDSSPRVRNAKHRLMQKDFLYPSLKRGTKAEKRKNEEIRRQRSRNVMNQLAESTREKGTPPSSRRGSATAAKIRPRAPSPFDPEKEERLRREAEQREKQKRLTMPISFNTFLSSKTSVLIAQPLLQPQRSSDRSTAPDHFYRELLCTSNTAVEPVEDTWNEFDMEGDDGLDVTTIEAVHIPKLDDYVAPPEMDESAEPVAAAVEKLLMRPMAYIDEDGISFLQERALEQPELRRNLLAMAIDCISSLHVARLSATGREAAVMVYNAVTTQASKMRDVICMFSREREEAVFWMHRYLIEMLPVELLASYLFLLRHTRLLNCQVKSIVRSTQNDSNPWPEITQMIIKYIEINVVEPDAAELDRTIASASLPDVIFVLVAPNVSVGDFSVRDRHYDSVFKWLRELGNPASVTVRLKIDETFSTAISEMFFTGVNMISRVVTKLVREHKQKRIVLVGWGTSCCFNHVVLNTVPGVSAVIDLAFPVLTIDGMRGEPDDDILLTYCPTLFVVGSEACDYHPGAMKYMRANMIMPTGLVVIGHANNNLVVSCSVLSRLRITQKVVNRCIVEQICDFLSMDWTKRERSRLVPMPLNDTFKIDLMQLKIDEKAAQASRKPKEESIVDSRGRKKKLSGTPLPSPIPREASPSPLPLSQLDSVRSNFQNLLKKAGNDKPSKWLEERPLLSSSFKEPRLPAKPGSAMASPVPARTESPNLLDPASISLT